METRLPVSNRCICRCCGYVQTTDPLLRADVDDNRCNVCGEVLCGNTDRTALACWALRYVSGRTGFKIEPGEWLTEWGWTPEGKVIGFGKYAENAFLFDSEGRAAEALAFFADERVTLQIVDLGPKSTLIM